MGFEVGRDFCVGGRCLEPSDPSDPFNQLIGLIRLIRLFRVVPCFSVIRDPCSVYMTEIMDMTDMTDMTDI